MDPDHRIFLDDSENAEEPPHLKLSADEIRSLQDKYSFSQKHVKQFMEAFSVFDRDADGLISSEELARVMMALGHRPSLMEVEALIKGVDKDNDGCVSFDEFLLMMTKITGDPEQELREVFSVLDVDQDGMLSLDDVTHVLTNLGEKLSPEEVKGMMTEADLNCDGVIDFQEFIGMLHAK